jgi:hypothetical protein
LGKETIGLISGMIVIISALPYSIRVWQKKINPNTTSWGLWTLIGLAILLNYKSSGAEANLWPAIFGFTNPLIITFLAIRKKGYWGKFTSTEWICLIISVISLSGWFMTNKNPHLAQYSLILAIIADVCAAIPTIIFLWKNPKDDRPFCWSLFAFAYGLAIFAVPEMNFGNLVLPIYMFVGANFITLPLIIYRIKNKLPINEWI